MPRMDGDVWLPLGAPESRQDYVDFVQSCCSYCTTPYGKCDTSSDLANGIFRTEYEKRYHPVGMIDAIIGAVFTRSYDVRCSSFELVNEVEQHSREQLKEFQDKCRANYASN